MKINYPDYKGYKIFSDEHNTQLYVRKSDDSSWGDYTIHSYRLKDAQRFIDKLIEDHQKDYDPDNEFED